MPNQSRKKTFLKQSITAALAAGAIGHSGSTIGNEPERQDIATGISARSTPAEPKSIPEWMLSEADNIESNEMLLAQAGEATECSSSGPGCGGGGSPPPSPPPRPDPYEPIYIPPELASQLAEDCFIATAATGSSSSFAVESFSRTRDEIIFHNSAGRRFIFWYYRNGPRYASIIRAQPALKALSNLVLNAVAKALPR